MRTCLLAWGSRGDVQPFVALARAMQDAGQDVVVAALDDFAPLVTGAGVTFAPFGLRFADLVADPDVRRWLTASSHSTRAELGHLRAAVEVFAGPAVAALARLVEEHEALVSGLLTADAVASVAPALGRRHALALLAPGVPTRSADAQLLPAVRREARLNRLTSLLGSLVTLRLGSPIRVGVERALGRPRASLRTQLRRLSATPTVIGASPLVVPPAPDWPARVEVTGWWQLPADPAWTPDPALAAFLEGRPVHLGLGSMPVTDPRGRLAAVDAALAATGLTAVVQGDLGGEASPSERILVAGDVPHDWLFPRVRAVVHHGGAGTTGAAFTAGVPQVVVPHIGDQPYWARRVAALGCGPAPLPLHLLDADTLAARLDAVVAGPFATTARALGERVRTEDGPARAVAALRRAGWS